MGKVKYTTKAGIANYPWLQPGRPDTAFDTDGKYKTELRMSKADGADLIALIDGVRDAGFPDKKKHATVRIPYSVDEETGEVLFKLVSKFQPKYYDAKGNPVPESHVPLLYSGSTLKGGGMCESYENGVNNGVALRLGAIQIIEPVSSGVSAGNFDPVDGYTTDPVSTDTSEPDYEF